MARRLLLLLLLLPQIACGGLLEGRVVRDGEPLAGVQVGAWPGLDPSGPALKLSEPSDAEGGYRLELPEGRYGIYARDSQRQLFAYCGRNPVAVPQQGRVWAGLQAVALAPVSQSPYDDEYSAGIEGVVLSDGKPLAGARVSLYLDSVEGLKGQGYRISTPTGADGYFSFDDLPESDYFLVARKRASGARVGPVQLGDQYGFFPGNPLRVRAGRLIKLQLSLLTKQKRMTADETPAVRAVARVRGRVVDSHGTPLAGLHLFAYTERVIGHKRPVALSPPTAADGLFELQLPAAGVYYLGARQLYGDSPAPGELFGLYDRSADHGLRVEAGALVEGVVIEAAPIDLFGQ